MDRARYNIQSDNALKQRAQKGLAFYHYLTRKVHFEGYNVRPAR